MGFYRYGFLALALGSLVGCSNNMATNEGGDPAYRAAYRPCSPQETEVASHGLLLAAAAGDLGELQRLTGTGLYSFDAKVGSMGRTALICAIENGHEDVVEFLLRRRVDPNITDASGTPALQFALINNQYKIAEMMISANVDINAVNGEGRTVLDEAQKLQEAKWIDLFTRNGGRTTRVATGGIGGMRPVGPAGPVASGPRGGGVPGFGPTPPPIAGPSRMVPGPGSRPGPAGFSGRRVPIRTGSGPDARPLPGVFSTGPSVTGPTTSSGSPRASRPAPPPEVEYPSEDPGESLPPVAAPR